MIAAAGESGIRDPRSFVDRPRNAVDLLSRASIVVSNDSAWCTRLRQWASRWSRFSVVAPAYHATDVVGSQDARGPR